MNNRENYKRAIDQIEASEELKNSTFEKIQEKQKIRKPAFIKYLTVCAVFAICFAVGSFYYKEGIPKKEEEQVVQKKVATANNDLPRFENMEQLREVIKENEQSNGLKYYVDYAVEESVTADATATNETVKSSSGNERSYSRTNTQVENVDEADIVKTDGNYIYYITLGKTYIINSQNLKVESIIEIDEDRYSFSPRELYINGDKLIILGNSYEYTKIQTSTDSDDIYYDISRSYQNNMAKAMVYDISDKKNPKQVREVGLDGYYSDSRMIGDNVYFISTKAMYYYTGIKDEELLPVIKDTVVSDKTSRIDCTDIAYFEGTDSYSYMMVAGFNINKNEAASTETFFGASDDVYASTKNLYITCADYKYYSMEEGKTTIYKFNLKNSQIVLQTKGEVKGLLHNQFSMDEYDGNLRIATTSNQYDEKDSENQLFILDENLKEIGKIENMAKGEKIYSVRFIGEVGYIVTFKQIDPLFVIDLSNPTDPKVKGELKIPGYSSYLHPYDENHIIGIGYNTKSNGYGGITNASMKMSMFDVSDLENPQELFSVDIGNQYTYSEITSNHKALFYNKDKNLIGFPATLREYNYKNDRDCLVLYKIDLQKGFEDYGKIEQEIDWRTNIDRAIYIDDTLYTLAEYKVTSYNLDNLEKIAELDLENDD